MSQCTCAKDKEATCIVHPTTQSLKEHIAKLNAQILNITDESDSWRSVAEYKSELVDELESMMWVAYRKSGSPMQYSDWRRKLKVIKG